MSHRRNAAFTLIEVMIVVVVMAILAAAVIPKFSSSTQDSKEALLRDHLRTMRMQIEVYKTQHYGNPPGNARNQLLSATDAYGSLSSTGFPDATHPYGPYLKDIPAQPFSNSTFMRNVPAGTPVPIPSPGMGWIYQGATGRLWVDHADYYSW